MRQGVVWGAWDRCLGGEPDWGLAARIGCSEETVAARRRALGVRAFQQSPVDWAEWDWHLGKGADEGVAREIGCSVATVRKRRRNLGIGGRGGGRPRRIDWAAWDGLLGTAPDTEVARTIGCSVRPVEKRRARLRVRPFQNHARICSPMRAFGADSSAMRGITERAPGGVLLVR